MSPKSPSKQTDKKIASISDERNHQNGLPLPSNDQKEKEECAHKTEKKKWPIVR